MAMTKSERTRTLVERTRILTPNHPDPSAPLAEQSPLNPRKQPGQERRKSRRLKDPVLIFLYRDGLHEKAARPLDLSLEGVGIETSGPLHIDEVLEIAIIVGESQISAQGRVLYTQRQKTGRFRSGLRFERISDRNRRIIELYLETTRSLGRSREDEGKR
jgi:hypothetical protein